MAKFYKSRYTAAQQDALLDIVEQGGSGGNGGGATESGDWEYYDVSSTVGSSDAGDMFEIASSLSGLGKLVVVDHSNNVITTKKIGPPLYASVLTEDESYSQIAINMAIPCIDLNGSYTLREAIEQDPNSLLATIYARLAVFPRITKEEFYTL